MRVLLKHFTVIMLCIVATCLVVAQPAVDQVTQLSPAVAARAKVLEAQKLERKERILPTRYCEGFFIVDVIINEEGPVPMILDTGASTTVIAKEWRKKLGLRRGKNKIRKLEMGPLTARSVPMIVRPLQQISDAIGTPLAGIIGHPIFASMTIVYDYPNERVVIHNERIAEDDPESVPDIGKRRPYFKVNIGSEEKAVLLDTGSRMGLSFDDFEERSFVGEGPKAIGGAIRIDGLHLRYAGRLAEDVTFGPVTLPTPVVTSSNSVSLMGQKFLTRYVLSVDGPGKRIRFDLPDTDEHPPIKTEPLRSLGLLSTPEGNTRRILKFLEGSQAEAAGLQIGDRILAVDGRPKGEALCEPAPEPHPRIKPTVVLTIERKDSRLVEDVTVEQPIFVE